MTSFVAIPAGDRLRLVDASVPACLVEGTVPAAPDADGVARIDLELVDGRIATLAPARSAPGLDLKGAMVFPTVVDIHTPLAKGHIWPRAQNRDGSFGGAVDAVRADRTGNWSSEDIRARFEFGLRCSYA
ncbi:hypothetical protein ABXV22_26545, partial [Vibrio rotiferianus]|uniref:hypothetical protein n=1 Tax=Vibrio rotiferianus TaxID=190895 RepID=UPI003391F84D